MASSSACIRVGVVPTRASRPANVGRRPPHFRSGYRGPVAARPLHELVDDSWVPALTPVAPVITELGDFLRAEVAAGRGYLPSGDNILRAFRQPLGDVRVLIVGQDPYPTPGHPVGLCFSVAPDVRPLPRSLVNIYTELHNDLGVQPPPTGPGSR